jgi:putative ABC transport system permease protein
MIYHNEPSPPFLSSPVVFTRYRQATNYIGRQRTQMSFALVKAQPNVQTADLAKRINMSTGLRAVSRDDFGWMTCQG